MKILFLLSLYGEMIGGAEVSTRELFEGLSKKGIIVKIATISNKTHSDINIINIPYSNIIPKKLIIPTTYITDKILELGLNKIIKKEKPNIIHIQDFSLINPGVKIAKKYNLPCIITVRDYRFLSNIAEFDDGRPLRELSDKEFGELLDKMLKRRNYPSYYYPVLYFLLRKQTKRILESIKKCDRVISISYFLKKLLKEQRVQKDKINVIHTFTKPNKIIKSNTKHKETIIFSPGRLVESKGFDWLIKSFNIALKDNKKIRLVIAGEGPARINLENLAKNLGISDKVRFTGKIAFNEMINYYSLCDIVVMPSLWPEPLGRITFEAFSFKKPIIASNIGGIPEIVSDKEGLLVEPGNEKDLAKKILILAKDKKLREKLGKAGYKKFITIENVENGVSKHLTIYNSLFSLPQNKHDSYHPTPQTSFLP